MTYTLKERFANKRKVQSMTLNQIKFKYGKGDLFKDEIKRRAISNKDEVINYYKKDKRNLNKKELEELINLLNLQAIEILSWDCYDSITDDLAVEYLLDDSWLDNENIVNKVSFKFLYETLLKNNNFYKYLNLIERLPIDQIKDILLSNNIDYSKIPNFISIINKYPILKKDVINKIINEKNIELMIQIITSNQFTSNEIIEFIQDCQNRILPSDFLKLLNNVPKEIITRNNSIFKEILNPISQGDLFDLLLVNNELFNALEDNIDINEFIKYFNNNIEKCLDNLINSKLVQYAFNNTIFKDHFIRDNQVLEKCLQYVLNNKDVFEYSIKNNIVYGKEGIKPYLLYSVNTLSLEEQNLIIEYFNIFSFNQDEILQLFDKYDYVREQLLKKSEFIDFLLNNNLRTIFKIIDKYPDTINIIDLNLIIKMSHSFVLKVFDDNPRIEKTMMNNEKFISYLLSSEQTIFDYMTLLNKYKVHNEIIDSYNEGFKKIQEVRPELSYGNSSLQKEMLSEEFINILGVNYIDAVLQFKTDASNIVVDLFNQIKKTDLNESKLKKLKRWLDFLCNNVSKNYRMIHYYILNYDKMESLADDLLKNNAVLTDYQKQILEEIIDNENIYNIKSLNELENYFEIKAQKILTRKNELSSNEFFELFLNISALEKGVPWKLSFIDLNELDYIKYKFVDTGILSKEEFEYLEKINRIKSQGYDMSMINDLVKEYSNKNVPTARSILNKIRNASIEEFNSKLIDLEDIRKIASYDNPNALVYIKIDDGIEHIYLNGYDFRSIVCKIESNGSKSTYSDLNFGNNGNSNAFEQYTVLGERIKEKYNYEGLSNISAAAFIKSNPENWKLIEATSTISTGLCSSKYSHEGYGWGKKSDISILGLSEYDQKDKGTYQGLRELSPSNPNTLIANYGLFVSKIRGEYWFDRFDENNERIEPEFIISTGNIEEDKRAARYFNNGNGIPIIHRNNQIYASPEFENELDKKAREKYEQSLDINDTDNILANNNNLNCEEKLEFLVNTLNKALSSGKIDFKTYKLKMIDIKWKIKEYRFYQNFNQRLFPKISNMVAEIERMELANKEDMQINESDIKTL